MTEILVLGATGKTGSRVVPRLHALGHTVRAASRSGATRFDWAERATWAPALAGAEAVYMVPTETLGLPERADFVARAEEAGVRRIVQMSVRGIDHDGIPPTERAVRDSGLEWTVLRPCWFAQNFADPGLFLPELLAGELTTPAGDGREPFIDAEDIADVAVAALTGPGHAGATYELSGAELMTFQEALSLIGEAAGREIRHRHIARADYVAGLVAAGGAADDAESFAGFLDGIRRGEDDYVSDGVERALGRAPRSFRDYVSATAARGVWSR
ncbi:NAD(P)H-binding protein [Streptomyces stramineus]|uniref:NAD(P)H-binding protein n=2 Tax=Streptomyces TaxID=1883 RepID=A0ABP3L2B7_9ACTN